MTESRPGNEIRAMAFRALQEFSSWLDSDPEVIELLSAQELRNEMCDLGLDPDRPVPLLPGRSAEAPSIDAKLQLGSDQVVFDIAASPRERRQTANARKATGRALAAGQLDRTRLLIARQPNGECTRKPIGALLRDPLVRGQLQKICRRFNFSQFGGSYGPEDLFQDACLKVWKCRSKLTTPGNILSDQEFCSWLFMIARCQYYNRIRQLNRLQSNGLARSEKPVEEFDFAAPNSESENKTTLRDFIDFLSGYPEIRQRTVRFWLLGYSYREIADRLKRVGEPCSHVTVGNWITGAINAFRRTIEAYDTEPARARALAARLSQR